MRVITIPLKKATTHTSISFKKWFYNNLNIIKNALISGILYNSENNRYHSSIRVYFRWPKYLFWSVHYTPANKTAAEIAIRGAQYPGSRRAFWTRGSYGDLLPLALLMRGVNFNGLCFMSAAAVADARSW